jgi:AP-4 complex subunit epsilon-1
MIRSSLLFVQEASGAVARFLGGDNHNLKYLGIHLLALLVRVNPAAAADHQLVVIDCLVRMQCLVYSNVSLVV